MHFSAPPQEVVDALRRLTPDALRRICEVASARDSEVRNLVLYEASTGPRGGQGRYGPGAAEFGGVREEGQQPEHFRWASNSFMLFSFKVKPCTNRAPHNFRTCPFGHPPNWIRRDPRQCRYVPVPCPYHAAGSCTLDNCPYAHSLLECSLHPYNYRNSRCRHGLRCSETVCFFAHSEQELRKPSKQYSPTLEEFKSAEGVRSPVDKQTVDQEALSAAEAKARTLLRSTSPSPQEGGSLGSGGSGDVFNALMEQGGGQQGGGNGDWPPLPSQASLLGGGGAGWGGGGGHLNGQLGNGYEHHHHQQQLHTTQPQQQQSFYGGADALGPMVSWGGGAGGGDHWGAEEGLPSQQADHHGGGGGGGVGPVANGGGQKPPPPPHASTLPASASMMDLGFRPSRVQAAAPTASWGSTAPVSAPPLADSIANGGSRGQQLAAAHWAPSNAVDGWGGAGGLPGLGGEELHLGVRRSSSGGGGGGGGGNRLRGGGLEEQGHATPTPPPPAELEQMLALMRLQQSHLGHDDPQIVGWGRSLAGHTSVVNG